MQKLNSNISHMLILWWSLTGCFCHKDVNHYSVTIYPGFISGAVNYQSEDIANQHSLKNSNVHRKVMALS